MYFLLIFDSAQSASYIVVTLSTEGRETSQINKSKSTIVAEISRLLQSVDVIHLSNSALTGIVSDVFNRSCIVI
jgi:hypothetical protein